MILLHERVQLERLVLIIDSEKPTEINNELVGRSVSISFQRHGCGGSVFHTFDVGKIKSMYGNLASIDYGTEETYTVKLILREYMICPDYKPTMAGKWRLLVAVK